MEEFEDFPNKVWWDIEKHFIEKMLMVCTYSDNHERTYSDTHMIIIISIRQEPNKYRLRVNISSGVYTNRKFSGSVSLDNLDSIVDKIYNLVSTQGGDNKETLNEWNEIKKPEIRDIKINNLLK